MKIENLEKVVKEWLEEREGYASIASINNLASFIRGLMDHEFVALNLQIVDLEDELLRPFCTEHRKHVIGGFCDECNGDRNLIQPRENNEQ